jgi:acetyltransferase-like isoleucine patch superfamily enzyme
MGRKPDYMTGYRPVNTLYGGRMAEGSQAGWRMWWAKRRWYERNQRLGRRLRIDRHAARGGFFVRYPVEGELLEALDEGRLRIGEGTLLEPGCWLTLAPDAEIEIGAGCFLNRGTMIASHKSVKIGDHTMFANGCFVGDAEHRFDDPEMPITWQGFTTKGPVEIGANCWFGVNCAVTSGVSVGERCVIGANSVVNRDLPARTISAGAPAKPIRPIEFRPSDGGGSDDVGAETQEP